MVGWNINKRQLYVAAHRWQIPGLVMMLRMPDNLKGWEDQAREELNCRTRLQPGSWRDGSANAAPGKGPGSGPQTLMEAHNHLLHLSGCPVSHSVRHGNQHTLGAHIYTLHILTCMQNTHLHKIKKNNCGLFTVEHSDKILKIFGHCKS